MLTRELVESLFDIKDGEFYHKPKLEADVRTKEWNRRYAGKKAGHVDGIGRYRVGIKDKWYKVSDILDMFETGVFVVKTRENYRFEALKYSRIRLTLEYGMQSEVIFGVHDISLICGKIGISFAYQCIV